MFARKVSVYGLLFCMFWVILALFLDPPLSKVTKKLCKGRETLAQCLPFFVITLIAWGLVKLIGSPIADFLDMITDIIANHLIKTLRRY